MIIKDDFTIEQLNGMIKKYDKEYQYTLNWNKKIKIPEQRLRPNKLIFHSFKGKRKPRPITLKQV